MVRRSSVIVRGLLIAVVLSAGASASLAAEQPLWPAASELTLAGNPLVPGGQTMPLSAVSCTSVGNCTAVGVYADNTTSVPIVASETGGVWGSARKLTAPATATHLDRVRQRPVGGLVPEAGELRGGRDVPDVRVRPRPSADGDR